jgi:hypothetical protein
LAATRLRPTDKAVGAYVAETEVWKALHAGTSAGVDFEELVALGNAVFDAISRWDAVWHQKVFQQVIPYDTVEEQRLDSLYAMWLVPSPFMLEEIGRFERDGSEVIGAADFRRHCVDARGALTPDDDRFGPELVPRQEEAIAAHLRGETEEFDELGA